MKDLKARIGASGLTLTWVSKKLGITREGLYNKLSGTSEFKASEIAILVAILGLTQEEQYQYFFARFSD